jgi:hypothetical protein
MRNATLDLGNTTLLFRDLSELEGFYWRIQANVYTGKERVFCIVLGTEVDTLKRKIRIPNEQCS